MQESIPDDRIFGYSMFYCIIKLLIYNILYYYYCRSSVSVQEVISNHESRILLIEGRQKDYDFLLNECKQLCKDKHYANDKVDTTVSPLNVYYSNVIGTEKASLFYT